MPTANRRSSGARKKSTSVSAGRLTAALGRVTATVERLFVDGELVDEQINAPRRRGGKLGVGPAPSYHAFGSSAAPAAGAVVADTGPVAAGSYEVLAQGGSDDTAAAGKFFAFEVRDAANATTVHGFLVPVPGSDSYVLPRIDLALNQRVRILTGAIAAAATSYRGDVYLRPTVGVPGA